MFIYRKPHITTSFPFPDKPQFPRISRPYELIEGRAATLNLTAPANPTKVKYTWRKESGDNDPFGDRPAAPLKTDDRVSVVNGVVILSAVSRSDAGVYTVTAENSEGASQTKIEVKVFYPPRYENSFICYSFVREVVLWYRRTVYVCTCCLLLSMSYIARLRLRRRLSSP